MKTNQKKTKSQKGRLVELDGIKYQIIDGKLYRYADLTMDKAFKIVLGRIGSEELLKNLLNSLLGTNITRLEYRNTEHPGISEEDRESRFDVYCEDADGTCFEVEMQNWSQKFIHKRAVYYSSLVVMDQAEKARRELRLAAATDNRKWNYDFKPLYVICFLNFRNSHIFERVKGQEANVISSYKYIDPNSGKELQDGTNLVFVDLDGFTKKLDDCQNITDYWIYSIRNMLMQHECPDELKGTVVEDLYARAELAAMSQKQRILLEENFMNQNDILVSIDYQIEEATAAARAEAIAEGRSEGLKIGIEEGQAKGRAEGRAEIARRMYEEGFTIEQIARLVECPEPELKQILDL